MNIFPLFLLMLPTLLLSSPFAKAQDTSNINGYQNFKWGQSRKSVETELKKQGIKYKNDVNAEWATDQIVVNQEIEIYPVEKKYSFVDGKLYAVYIFFYSNKQSWIEGAFEFFLKQLYQKYGEWKTDTTFTFSSRERWRMISWEFKSSFINATQRFDESNMQSSFARVLYFSPSLSELYDKKQAKAELLRQKADSLARVKTSRQF